MGLCALAHHTRDWQASQDLPVTMAYHHICALISVTVTVRVTACAANSCLLLRMVSQKQCSTVFFYFLQLLWPHFAAFKKKKKKVCSSFSAPTARVRKDVKVCNRSVRNSFIQASDLQLKQLLQHRVGNMNIIFLSNHIRTNGP